MASEAYEASSVQKRLYHINQLYGDSILYNMPFAWIIEGQLQPLRLENAVKKLVQRHETLRTSFSEKDGEVLQKFHEHLEFQLKPLSNQLAEYLAAALPDYMIPSHFIEIKNIPLNPNVKVDRKALPQPEELPPIGIDDNFFELGGHSLKAVRIIAKIHKELEIKLSLLEIFTSPTIREMAASAANIEKKQGKQTYLPFRVIDLTSMGKSKKQQEREKIFVRETQTPFDLSKAPIFRSILVKLEPDQYDFILNVYHIIADGWSVEILKKEFLSLYNAFQQGKDIDLEPLQLQYTDLAGWLNQQINSPATGKKTHEYWKSKLEEGFPPLSLPCDYPKNCRPPQNTGAFYRFVIHQDIQKRLKTLAAHHQTSLFIVMFSAVTAATDLENFDSFHDERPMDEKFPLILQFIEFRNGIEMALRYKKALFKPSSIENMANQYVELLDEMAGIK
jgi:acyl carrier protein